MANMMQQCKLLCQHEIYFLASFMAAQATGPLKALAARDKDKAVCPFTLGRARHAKQPAEPRPSPESGSAAQLGPAQASGSASPQQPHGSHAQSVSNQQNYNTVQPWFSLSLEGRLAPPSNLAALAAAATRAQDQQVEQAKRLTELQ